MTIGIIDQLRTASRHPVASLAGALFGGWVPLATYTEAHQELRFEPGEILSPAALMVIAGLTFSAKTVWQWARLAFDDPWKATGFVLLLESVMVFSGVPWLAKSALCYLVAINAVATACVIGSADGMSEWIGASGEDAGDVTVSRLSADEAQEGTDCDDGRDDDLYPRALRAVTSSGICSVSYLQQELRVGFNKASRLVRRLEREGVVGPAGANRRRPVLTAG